MMKRLIVLGIVAVMVLAASAAFATMDTAWVVQLRVADANNGAAATAGQFGFGAAATAKVTIQTTQVGIICPDAGGTPPDWYKDVRVAPSPGANVTWNLIVRAGTAFAGSTFTLSAWNPTGTAYDIDATLADAAPGCKIQLYQGDQLLYQFDPAKNGTSAAPQWSQSFSIAAGQEVSGFRLCYIVPEPGSMVAMLSGLIGLVGFGIRRRK